MAEVNRLGLTEKDLGGASENVNRLGLKASDLAAPLLAGDFNIDTPKLALQAEPEDIPAPPIAGPRNAEAAKANRFGYEFPAPKNFNEGIAEFGRIGAYFDERDHAVASQLESYADILTLRYVELRGLKGIANTRSRELTDEVMGKVRGAMLGTVMSEYRTPSNEERREMQKRFAGTLLETVQKTAMVQLQETDDPSSQKKWQELFATAKGFSSRLDEANVLGAVINWSDQRLEEARLNRAHLGPRENVELDLGSEILRFADFADDPRHLKFDPQTDSGIGLLGTWRPEHASNAAVVSALNVGLSTVGEPLAPAQFVIQAANGIVTSTRAQQDYGLPLEEANQLGIIELLHIRHPNLAADMDELVLRAATRREMGAEAFSTKPDRVERALNKRIASHPAKITESFLFTSDHLGAPLMSEINKMTFDPRRVSSGEFGDIPAAVGDVVRQGIFQIGNSVVGVGYKAAIQAITSVLKNPLGRDQNPTFHDPDGRLRRYSDLNVEEIREWAETPEKAEELARSPQGPMTAALNRDLASGKTTFGTFMAVMNPDNSSVVAAALLESHRFFPIADDLIQRLGGAGLGIEAMQREWQDTKRVIMGEVVHDSEFGSDKDVEKKLGKYATEIRKLNPLAPTSDGVWQFTKDTLNPLKITERGFLGLQWAAAQTKNLYNKVTDFAVEKPEELGAILLTDFLIGDAILAASINGAGRIVRPVMNSLQATRQTRRVADHIATGALHSRPVVQRIGAQIKKFKTQATAPGYLRNLTMAEDALDTMDVIHASDILKFTKNRRAAPSIKGAHRPQTRLRRALRNLNESDRVSLQDDLGLLDSMLSAPHLANKTPLIPAVGKLLGDMFHIRGTPVTPLVLQHSDDIWRNIKRAAEDGTLKQLKREDAVNLISLRASSESRGASKQLYKDLKQAIFNKHGDRAVLTDDGFVNDLLDFFGAARERLHTFRQFAGEKRLAATEFLDHVLRSRSRAAANAPDRSAFNEVLNTTLNAKRQSQNIHFTQAIKFDEHPVLAHLTIDDVVSWTSTHEGAGNNFFRRMAKLNETENEFWTRVSALAGTEGEAEFLQVFAREYLNAPSIRRRFAIDPYSGRPVTGPQGTKLRKERAAVERLRDREAGIEALRQKIANEVPNAGTARRVASLQRREALLARQRGALDKQRKILEDAAGKGDLPSRKFLDELAADPEVEFRKNVYTTARDDWETVEGYAAAADSIDMQGTLIRYQDMTNHDPLAALSAIRAAHTETALRIGGLQRRQEKLWEAYEAATPEVRTAFDKALTAQEQSGDFLPMIELRKKNPHLFKALNPNVDEALDFMLDESKTLRGMLIDQLEEAGWFRNADEATRWRRPWTSQQWKEMVDTEALDITVPAPTGGARKAGLTNNEFITRREKKDWKLVVSRRNKATEELKFKSADDAEVYLQREYGAREADLKRRGDGDISGKTATGDDFTVMAPLGDAFLDVFTELPPGFSTLKRMETLMEQVAVARTARVIDLPGLRLTEAQVNKLKGTLRGDTLLRDYTHISPDNRKFGVLKGKWVHRKALRTMQDAQVGASAMKELGQTMRASAQLHERLFDNWLGKGISGAFAIPTRAIGANAIFRRPRTMQKNTLSNHGIFGPMAVGGHRKYLFGKNAREGHRLATILTLGDPLEVNKLIKSNPIAKAVFEQNVLDDTLGHGLIKKKSHRVMRRLLFGDDPSDILNSPRAWKKALGTVFGRRAGITDRVATFKDLWKKLNPLSESPAIRALEKELDRMTDLEKTGKLGDLTASQREILVDRRVKIIAKLDQQKGTMGAVSRVFDYAGLIIQGRNFRRAGVGRFSDNSLVSAEFYGAIDNYARIKAFAINMLEGMQPGQSVGKVNRYMQRYGHGYLRRVPEFARGPLGSPAISFPLESARISANIITDQPGMFLGLWHTLPLLNAVSLAASNVDPNYAAEMFQDQSGGFGRGGVMNSGLIVASGNNQLSYMAMEYLDIVNPARHPFEGGSPEPTGALQVFGKALENFGARLIGGNATAKSVIFGMQGRDSRSGLRNTGKSKWQQTVDNFAQEFAPYALPPYFPLQGKLSSDLIESNNLKAGAKFTGRVRSVAERVFEEITGTPIKGLADKLEEAVTPFARWSLLLAGDPKGLAREIRYSGAYNENDFLRMVILTSKQYDKLGTGNWEYRTDSDFRELDAAEELGDTDRVKEITRRIAAKQLMTRVLGGQVVEIPLSRAEMTQMTKSVYDNTTIDEVFMGMNLTRKISALINVVASGAPKQTLNRIADLTISTGQFELFEGTTPAQMARAANIVEPWLRQAPEGPGKTAMEKVWSHINAYRAQAAEEADEELFQKQAAAEAFKMYREAGLQPTEGDFRSYYEDGNP